MSDIVNTGNPSESTPVATGTEAPIIAPAPVQSDSTVPSANSSQGQPGNDKAFTPEEIRALQGKVSASDTERNTFAKENEKLKKTVESYGVFEESLASDPTAYEVIRQTIKKAKNIDIGEYNTRFPNSQPPQQTPQAADNNSKGLDADSVRKISQETYQNQRYYENGLDKFLNVYDKYKVENLKGAEQNVIDEALDFVDRAEKMAAQFDLANPNQKNADWGDRMIWAGKILSLESTVQNATEAGKLIGKSDVINANTGVQGGPAGGTNTTTDDSLNINSLSESDKAAYYRLLKHNGKGVATRFLQKSLK
jgi:hypothetical protein